MRIKILLIIAVLYIIGITNVYAEWIGPQEIIVGTWGSEVGQFYFGSGDTTDSFPREFGVDKDGVILISDEDNKRLLIYNSDGSLRKMITKPTELPAEDSVYGWPSGLAVYSGGNSVAISCEYKRVADGIQPYKKCFLDYNGAIIARVDMGQVFPIETGFIILKSKSYTLYSPTGALIRTTTERPLELGKVKEKKTASGYTYTVQYPDIVNPNVTKTWEIVRDSISKMYSFVRDKNGILYAVSRGQVIRYDDQGNEIGRLMLPKKRFKPTTIPPDLPPGAEIRREVSEEYGEPVISPTGDVYTWKRTPTAYSIIKWTWR